MNITSNTLSGSGSHSNQRKDRKLIYICVGILILLIAIVIGSTALQSNNPSSFSEMLDDVMRGTEIESIHILEYSFSTPSHKHSLYTKDQDTIAYILSRLTDLQIKEDPDTKSNHERTAYHFSISNANGLMLGVVLSDGGILDSYDYVTGNSAGRYLVLNEFDFDAIERLLEQESK